MTERVRGSDPAHDPVPGVKLRNASEILTDRLFLGGENLLVGLPSTVSGALRLVLRLDLKPSSDYQLAHRPSAPLVSLEATNTHFRADCCFSATTEKQHRCSLSASCISLQEPKKINLFSDERIFQIPIFLLGVLSMLNKDGGASLGEFAATDRVTRPND